MQHNYYDAGVGTAKILKNFIKQGFACIHKAWLWFIKTFF